MMNTYRVITSLARRVTIFSKTDLFQVGCMCAGPASPALENYV